MRQIVHDDQRVGVIRARQLLKDRYLSLQTTTQLGLRGRRPHGQKPN